MQKCFLFGCSDVSVFQVETFFLTPNKYQIVGIPSLTAYIPRNNLGLFHPSDIEA